MSTIASTPLAELAYEWCTETDLQLSASEVADPDDDTIFDTEDDLETLLTGGTSSASKS
ncbi:hypothetical protein [Rhodococcus sp. WMMA185]|uniref:hypothetical protein n=1 Tax=Rhodococcus sp. WMMA185 TaxID=679318 RepID=UPI0012F4C52F|nr:hypothetical protein [Rhodococcus sp. WMMA185]